MKSRKIEDIINTVENILNEVHQDQKKELYHINHVHEAHQKSATNLINYLSLRSHDICDLQRKLGYLGMSRLARAEAHTEASLKSTLFYLHRLIGQEYHMPTKFTLSIKRSEKLLAQNTQNLLGDAHSNRRLRVMVTIPENASKDEFMVDQMVTQGMDVARINCAHDGPETWLKMIQNVKRASEKFGREVVISMDIGGPKIRTGQVGHSLMLNTDDLVILSRLPLIGHPARYDEQGLIIERAKISCTLPEVFDYLKAGDIAYFDDGIIKGIIEELDDRQALIKITRTAIGGSKLKADKGINFPDSKLKIHGLTEQDRVNLKFIAKHADVVNFSFVNTPEDVKEIHNELKKLDAFERLGIIYKIETQLAYDNLTMILLEAMKGQKIGVMIARGDLAIEAGWKRMGSIQKEMLAICNACHIPVVWATQVLENLAKRGLPSRSEITDAVNAAKADCIMLNKGPHIIKAIQLLDQIIESAESFQDKNAPMLPKLTRLSAVL
ncbi:MAG: pyruvate kinase [Cyclobacteriaceae bacterium]|jgi:pyruvate kinase